MQHRRAYGVQGPAAVLSTQPWPPAFPAAWHLPASLCPCGPPLPLTRLLHTQSLRHLLQLNNFEAEHLLAKVGSRHRAAAARLRHFVLAVQPLAARSAPAARLRLYIVPLLPGAPRSREAGP